MSLRDGFGAKLMAKMGWSDGNGLGSNADGILNPIAARKRPENLGIGAQRRPHQDNWWEKIMNDAYGESEEMKDPNALFNACEGRRCRPHGSAKLARLDAHDERSRENAVVQKPQESVRVSETKKERKLKKIRRREKVKEVAIVKKRSKRIRKGGGKQQEISCE